MEVPKLLQTCWYIITFLVAGAILTLIRYIFVFQAKAAELKIETQGWAEVLQIGIYLPIYAAYRILCTYLLAPIVDKRVLQVDPAGHAVKSQKVTKAGVSFLWYLFITVTIS